MISEVFQESLYIVGGYLLLFFSMIFSLNWLSKGFLWQWLRVRMSRGKKLLVELHGSQDTYYMAGEMLETNLHTKNKRGEKLMYVGIKPECVYNTLGVQAIDIDEVNKCLWTRQGAVVQGNDPIEADALYNRCLKKPAEANLLVKVLIASLIILLLALLVMGFMGYELTNNYAVLSDTLRNVTTVRGGFI